jgi:hypothetical protein
MILLPIYPVDDIFAHVDAEVAQWNLMKGVMQAAPKVLASPMYTCNVHISLKLLCHLDGRIDSSKDHEI